MIRPQQPSHPCAPSHPHPLPASIVPEHHHWESVASCNGLVSVESGEVGAGYYAWRSGEDGADGTDAENLERDRQAGATAIPTMRHPSRLRCPRSIPTYHPCISTYLIASIVDSWRGPVASSLPTLTPCRLRCRTVVRRLPEDSCGIR